MAESGQEERGYRRRHTVQWVDGNAGPRHAREAPYPFAWRVRWGVVKRTPCEEAAEE